MIVAVPEGESPWEALQASLVLKRSHKRLNRTVIQALIRERLELAVVQDPACWRDDLAAGSQKLTLWLREQLQVHGLELASLELLGLPRVAPAREPGELMAVYLEVWLDQLATSDGFELNLALVARAWVPSYVAGQPGLAGLDGELRRSAQGFFSPLDAESALAGVSRWQASLAPIWKQLSSTYRVAAALLQASQTGLFREDPRVGLDASWVTRRRLNSLKGAFQPGRRYGFLDPYQLFFMLKDRQGLQQRYRSGRG